MTKLETFRALPGNSPMKPSMRRICSFCLVTLLLLFPSSQACTIFVLMDGQRAFFFNNEDYSNPKTRLWFVPAGTNYLGCAYVGFDDGWAQGGVNTAGLAFDWVAGYTDKYKPAPSLLPVRGNSSQRMLETCSTVDQAIHFYRTYREVEFHRARIMVADKSGASAIIGARDGQIHVDRKTTCRGFGYGREVVAKMLATPPEATVGNGIKILQAALQEGEFGTKYSSVYDLNNGDIFLFQLSRSDSPRELNLHTELLKGAHSYDIPELQEDLTAPLSPLPDNAKRFLMDDYKPIPDTNRVLTLKLTRMMKQAARGTMREEDYDPEMWKMLEPERDQIKKDLANFGRLKSLTLVNRLPQDDANTHRYKVSFTKATVLQTFTIDDRGAVLDSESEGVEFIP